MNINIEDITVSVIRYSHEAKMSVAIEFDLDELGVFSSRKNKRGLEAKLRDEVYKIVKEL